MKSDNRLKMRPQPQTSIIDKKFNDGGFRKKRITVKKVSPLLVLLDLRRGSLKSLDRYLAQQKGLPDREVALELRKLISGSSARTKYRITVVDHPNAPKGKGGRPKTTSREPTAAELELAEAYEAEVALGGKTAAVIEVAKTKGISESGVRKAVKLVAEHKERVAKREAKKAAGYEARRLLHVRGELALENIRKSNLKGK